jgi:hypothetical protein
VARPEFDRRAVSSQSSTTMFGTGGFVVAGVRLLRGHAQSVELSDRCWKASILSDRSLLGKEWRVRVSRADSHHGSCSREGVHREGAHR